jgi:hypothetical protein
MGLVLVIGQNLVSGGLRVIERLLSGLVAGQGRLHGAPEDLLQVGTPMRTEFFGRILELVAGDTVLRIFGHQLLQRVGRPGGLTGSDVAGRDSPIGLLLRAGQIFDPAPGSGLVGRGRRLQDVQVATTSWRAVTLATGGQEADADIELGIGQDIGQAAGGVIDHGRFAAGEVGGRIVPLDHTLRHNRVLALQVDEVLQRSHGRSRVEINFI